MVQARVSNWWSVEVEVSAVVRWAADGRETEARMSEMSTSMSGGIREVTEDRTVESCLSRALHQANRLSHAWRGDDLRPRSLVALSRLRMRSPYTKPRIKNVFSREASKSRVCRAESPVVLQAYEVPKSCASPHAPGA